LEARQILTLVPGCQGAWSNVIVAGAASGRPASGGGASASGGVALATPVAASGIAAGLGFLVSR
jgi:hypothetical protein